MKVALCVGINKYSDPVDTLRGCLHDSEAMWNFFRKEVGVMNPTLLQDEEAEEARIKDKLKEMRRLAISGGVSTILYSHSSHGSNNPDLDGDEADGLDEVLCCHDIKSADGVRWTQGFIDDDWLRNYTESLPGYVLFECFFDACHSQTMLREMGLRYDRAKIILPPKPNFTIAPKSKLLGITANKRANTVAWSGCDADKTSADAYIDGIWRGAFTSAFLKSHKPGLTRSDTIFFTRRWLKANGYEQFPHLECNQELAFRTIGG